MRDGWFDGRETVLITAGASAPEDVVQECVDHLRERFGATVESADGARGARQLPAAEGTSADPAGRARVSHGDHPEAGAGRSGPIVDARG